MQLPPRTPSPHPRTIPWSGLVPEHEQSTVFHEVHRTAPRVPTSRKQSVRYIIRFSRHQHPQTPSSQLIILRSAVLLIITIHRLTRPLTACRIISTSRVSITPRELFHSITSRRLTVRGWCHRAHHSIALTHSTSQRCGITLVVPICGARSSASRTIPAPDLALMLACVCVSGSNPSSSSSSHSSPPLPSPTPYQPRPVAKRPALACSSS